MDAPNRLPCRASFLAVPSRTLPAFLALVALAPAALAIPSPDVMVNLFASSAQVLGLVSVVLGRWLWVRRSRGSGTPAGGGRGYRAAFLTALALFAVSSIGWGLYALQVADERNQRLQVNLNRSSSEEGKKVVDVSLRELPFSKQLERKDGTSTDELVRRLAGGGREQILDVREAEEFEVGAIEGAAHARFPDVLAAPDLHIDKSRPVLLLCFNGNRSSELAEELARRGFVTSFLVGGYEKWLAEDRPIASRLGRERRDLREIPDYPNKEVLLGTEDVMSLLEEREVTFLDLRYPGDFEVLGHLPGAVNVPFRKLVTPELDAALAALPREKPIVVACYDKRSSFFGLIAGLRLTRMGYEFLGRYTTPESFAVPGKDKPHVAAWRAAQEQKTLLGIASQPLAGALEWSRERAGSLALGILLLVLLARAAVSPLTVRAERDRRRQLTLKPEIDALKARWKDDPQARARATMALLSRNGVKPVWNVAGSLVQLLLFTLFFGVVSQASAGSTEAFLWVAELGVPDPTWLLAGACALAMAAIVVQQGARLTRKRALAALAVAGLLLALVAGLSAGTQLYLASSLGLLLAHNHAVGSWLAWRDRASERAARRIERRYAGAVLVPLRHAHAALGCGAKAARLGRLIEAGLPVPDGFVVRGGFAADGTLEEGARAAIRAAHARLGAPRVAVRSSGLNEDGAAQSFAGVFDTLLDVGPEALLAAIEQVARSWDGERSRAYSSSGGESGAIVVQAMVPAEFAGVLFTEHPGESGSAAVELVEGLGDDLVSGRRQPHGFRLGRVTGRVLDGGEPPIPLAPLFALGRRVEALFGEPQDVEWAFAGGRYVLLQSRDVTRLSRGEGDERARRESERARLLALAGTTPGAVALAQNELSELLPRPTPLSLSLMQDLWEHGGTTHRACQALGVPYDALPDGPPLLVTAFGELYVDQREASRRSAGAPSALACFRVARGAERMEASWRDEHRPRALRAARRDAALDLGRLLAPELVELFRERRARFVHEDYARAEEINVAADVHMKTAVRALERAGLDPAAHLSRIPPTVVHEAGEILARIAAGSASVEEFLEHSGHRSPHDWELAHPRYAQDHALVAGMARRAQAGAAPRAAVPAPAPRYASAVLELAVERALRWQALKEEAKHLALRELAFLRRVLIAIGERTGLGDEVFLLRCDEVERLDDAAFLARDAGRIVRARSEEREALCGVRLPAQITAAQLEELDLQDAGAVPRPVSAGALRGLRVSGTGGVIGRARVLRAADEIESFQEGEILVARFTDPTWMPLFPRARAIVTEVGGWLSHAAIQAREYGLPAVVGVPGALDGIRTGDVVRLAPDGVVDVLGERRREERVAVALDVVVRRQRGELRGRIADVSASGAQLEIAEDRLELGEELSLVATDGAVHRAQVVRNGVPGIYGIHVRLAAASELAVAG